MPLNWSIADVKGYEDLCWIPTGEFDDDGKERKRLNGVTETLVFATMFIGFSDISAKNIDEWEFRFQVLTEIGDTFLSDEDGAGRNPTREELEAHIGLGTNASSKTNAAFWKDVRRKISDRAERSISYRNRKQEPATA